VRARRQPPCKGETLSHAIEIDLLRCSVEVLDAFDIGHALGVAHALAIAHALGIAYAVGDPRFGGTLERPAVAQPIPDVGTADHVPAVDHELHVRGRCDTLVGCG
jgi:hypothetical protein